MTKEFRSPFRETRDTKISFTVWKMRTQVTILIVLLTKTLSVVERKPPLPGTEVSISVVLMGCF